VRINELSEWTMCRVCE